MPIQILDRPESTGQKFAKAFAKGSTAASQLIPEHIMKKEQVATENQAILKATGIDLTGIIDPEQRQEAFKQALIGKREADLESEKEKRRRNLIQEVEGISEKEPEPRKFDIEDEEKPRKKSKDKFAKAKKYALAGEKDLATIAGKEAELEQRERAQRSAESQKLKEDILQRGNAALKGIQNKKHLIDIIKTGKINDPTYAAFAELLPYNFGQRLLSPETSVYKAGLVDEYGDLRNIFQGQTRVKEIDILEKKIADIYLTDEQKEAVLKTRIDSLQSDVLKAEAASEIEREMPDLGMFEFNNEVNKRTQEKMKPLFDKILDEQKFIIDQAEKRKNFPLDPDNPEDAQIIDQLLEEAGGSEDRAIELARKKGYKF